MKNVLKRMLVLVFAFTTITSIASSRSASIKVLKVKDNLINLKLMNLNESVAIALKDNDGITLYKEKVVNSYFSKNFDLRNLEDGRYIIELENFNRIKEVSFSIVSGKVILEDAKEVVKYKPIVNLKGNSVYISKLCLNYETLEITMYDSDGNNLYNEMLSGKRNLGIKLNIEQLEVGKYDIVMKSGDKIFYKTIRKI